ncbi:MAG: hypothetical protein ACRD8W_01630 [Nitrososphaeraceae archaeon]
MVFNNYNPDDLDKSFNCQIDRTNDRDELYSTAALEDKLVSTISSYNTSEVIEKVLYIKWHYLDQAEALIYRINVYDPLPEFVIFTEDIPDRLSQELNSLEKVTTKKIITNAVRRIYESVDPEYFHTNGIHGKVRWRFDHRL